MKNKIQLFINLILLVFLITFSQISSAQSKEEKAYEKGMQAIEMDNGEIDKSIILLEEAKKLDPKNVVYPYELAYAHVLNKNYKEAIKIAEGIKSNKNATDRFHQLLGNAYSMNGQREKAIEAYENGLKKFPNSGKLYLERGNVELYVEEYTKALNFYEKGIKAEPEFPSNYFWASKIYCASTEEIWGMIYGEIFMNLERNSKRTAEISELLFKTYKKEIKFISDTSFSVSFSQNNTVNAAKLNDKQNILPFGLGVYEPLLIMSLIDENKIELSSLNRIRTRFLGLYYEGNHNKNYNNILFDYQRKVQQAGHFDAYNYWILSEGDNDEYENWIINNEAKWNNFAEWFTDNQLSIKKYNYFHSSQY